MAITKPKSTKATHENVAYILRIIRHGGTEDDIRLLKDYAEKYDWPEPVFEENGHKGLRDLLGNVLVPPMYDGYAELDWNLILRYKIAIAKKDGLYGIVNANGKDKALSSFDYDKIIFIHKHGLFLVHRPGDTRHSILDDFGDLLVPNLVDQIVECTTSKVVYKGGSKYGVVMINRNPWSGVYSAFEPIFDNIRDIAPETFMEFELDGEVGYLSDEPNHVFVAKKDYDDFEEDVMFYTTRFNEYDDLTYFNKETL